MKTLKQIARELGYAKESCLYGKLKRRGCDITTLEREYSKTQLHHGNTILYSESSERYIKELAGFACRKPSVSKQPAKADVEEHKDLSSKPIQSTAEKAEKKAAPTKTRKVAKSKVSVPKATKAEKVQATSPVTTTTLVSQVNLDHRLQQLQVLGEVLVAQINQLTSEVSGQATKQVATATYSVAS